MPGFAARLRPLIGLILFAAFSPAGIEVAHAASHCIHGDLRQSPHGAGLHRILPDGATVVDKHESAPRFDVHAIAPAPCPAEPVPSRPRATPVASARIFLVARGPSSGRAPPA